MNEHYNHVHHGLSEPDLGDIIGPEDLLDWNVEEQGRMRNAVDSPPETVLWIEEEE